MVLLVQFLLLDVGWMTKGNSAYGKSLENRT